MARPGGPVDMFSMTGLHGPARRTDEAAGANIEPVTSRWDATARGITAESVSQRDSRIALRRARSLRLARRMAVAISGATTLENPDGSPRLRSRIRVDAPLSEVHV